jgi:GTP-binding protein
MIIRSAKFVSSSPALKSCPAPDKPEFGFIGRSNVGKSSLINMLTGFSRLAKISSEPGKTRTINHFIINNSWYLVDLPGYGYAKVSADLRARWSEASMEYILKRENLICLFVLIDPRIKPQKADLDFLNFLGLNGIPCVRIFTKADKLTPVQVKRSVDAHDSEMLKSWESLPPTFISSARTKEGRIQILDYIAESFNNLSNKA